VGLGGATVAGTCNSLALASDILVLLSRFRAQLLLIGVAGGTERALIHGRWNGEGLNRFSE